MEANLEYIREHQHLCHYPFNYYTVNYSTVNSTHVLRPGIFYQEVKSKYKPAEKRFTGSLDLWAKLWSTMRYFLENTNYAWLWRGTDDVLVIFERLGGFMEELDRKYDPMSESVVLGHCIYNRPSHYAWLQGGSGMIFSRKAVEIMEPRMEKYMKNMLTDDIRFTELLQSVNLSMKSATCESFIGHYPEHRDQRLLRNMRYDKMPKCPPEELLTNATLCRNFVSPISDIVFYHAQVKGTLNVFRWMVKTYNKYLKNAPRGVKWYMEGRSPVICYDPNM